MRAEQGRTVADHGLDIRTRGGRRAYVNAVDRWRCRDACATCVMQGRAAAAYARALDARMAKRLALRPWTPAWPLGVASAAQQSTLIGSDSSRKQLQYAAFGIEYTGVVVYVNRSKYLENVCVLGEGAGGAYIAT